MTAWCMKRTDLKRLLVFNALELRTIAKRLPFHERHVARDMQTMLRALESIRRLSRYPVRTFGSLAISDVLRETIEGRTTGETRTYRETIGPGVELLTVISQETLDGG